MATYNQYFDIKNFTNLPNMSSEIIPKASAFAMCKGDEIAYDTSDIMKYPANLSALAEHPLPAFARHVLSVIATYEFVTSKMITEILGMMNVETDQTHITKTCERLRKTGLVHTFRFCIENGVRTTNYIVYSLTKMAGENALKVLEVAVQSVNAYNIVQDPANVKKKLMTNQILISHLLRNAKIISCFQKSERLTSTKSNDSQVQAVVRPTLSINYDDDDKMLYEVVRSGDFWEGVFRDKLERYKVIFENWDTEKGNLPTLIICCENYEHSLSVKKICDEVGIDVFFTSDMLFFGKCFRQHIYKIDEKDKAVHYNFEV